MIVGPIQAQMDDFCDLHGTPDTPVSRIVTVKYTVRNYLHGLPNSGESIEDSDLHAEFGPLTW